MKTMIALRMGSEMIQISFIWIPALIIASSNSQDVPRIKNLDCVNDFIKTMVCFWEVVNGDTNCSSEFQLKYAGFDSKTLYCQDLDNEYDGNFRVPGKCICNINVATFIATEFFYIEVESQGKSVSNATINIFSTVKPKPPLDLRANLTDLENGVIHWKSNYENCILKTTLTFHIQFISKEDDKMVLEDFLPRLEPRYMFSKRQLSRGDEYRVRVRMTHNNGEPPKEIWSEWSPEVEFRNDYNLNIMEHMRIIIPVSCGVVLLLILSCYISITRAKEKWWNTIPDPARSKLAQSKLIQKNSLTPTGKSCGGCLSQLVKAHTKSKHKQFPKEHPIKDSVNHLRNNVKTIIFEPEKVDIESCIQLYPREDDNLYQEDSPEDKEEDFHLMVTDLSIGRMFCDILCDSSMEVEALEQLHMDNTFGSSILREHFPKTERHLPLSMVSQESGYQSYDSDYSPGDSKLDGPNALYFDHPLSQSDFLPYAPVPSINYSGSQIEDAFVNSGYNSFATALAEATSDTMEGDNRSVLSLDSLFSKPSYKYSLQNPKSILYYNGKCFPTHYKDDLRPTMTPTSDHIIDTRPSSISEVSGYQSFNQAVQQGETSISTTCLDCDFGYKPFESLISIPTNRMDNIGGLSESDTQCPYQDSVQNNEDLPKTGMVNGWTAPWNDTHCSDFNLTELNFFERKYPFCSWMLGGEHKGLVNQASNIHCYIDRTLQKGDKPLALTFDISDHLKNIANMQGPKMAMDLGFVGHPTNLIPFPCSQEETPITLDGLHANKDFPMKFENKSYFAPLHSLKTRGYSRTKRYLLVKQNDIDEEGNLYMKITLW